MSTRTITALFETRSDAEHARDRLGKSGIPFTSMQLMQNTAAASDTDRRAYEEGLRRGGTLLAASVEDDKADAAISLERKQKIDDTVRRTEVNIDKDAGERGQVPPPRAEDRPRPPRH